VLFSAYVFTVGFTRLLLLLSISALTLLSACQSTGPIQTGRDTYMISKSSAGGAFANMEALKREVIQEANAFAASKGKTAERVSSEDVRPSAGFPSYEYHFRLVDPAR